MQAFRIFALGLLALTAINASAARHALVVGNDSYTHVTPLKNARADAKAMAKVLEDAGFAVTLVQDQTRNDFNGTLRQFKAQVSGGDEVVVFYAGHGVQLGGANYLLPIDLKSDSEDQIKDDAVQLQRVLDDLSEKQARFSLVIIDACRDNPLKGRGRNFATRGLAPTSVATGQMIMYSAGSGQQALDYLGEHDRDENSLFTRVLLKQIANIGVPIDRVLKNVRSEVARLAKSAGHEQVPAIYDQSLGDFFFRRGSESIASSQDAIPVVPLPTSVPFPNTLIPGTGPETVLWSAVSATNNIADYMAFLRRYPQGTLAEEARRRITSLEAQALAVLAKQDRGAWEAAEAKGEVQDYLAYLEAYQQGNFVDLARVRLGFNLPMVLKFAVSGNVTAQRNIGAMYAKGLDIAKDEREAAKWYRKAVEHGDAQAQTYLGVMYAEGRGVAKDEREAFKLIRKAAEQGNAEAQRILGSMYERGIGVKKDEKEAVTWTRKAAEQGDKEAQLAIGISYILGIGVTKDEREAATWIHKAAERGDPRAQLIYSAMIREGTVVAKDEHEAVGWVRKAAEQGYVDAQIDLGSTYAFGWGGVKNDLDEAVKWWIKAADTDKSQINLGLLYFKGNGGDFKPNKVVGYALLRVTQYSAQELNKLAEGMSANEIAAAKALAEQISKRGSLVQDLNAAIKDTTGKKKPTLINAPGALDEKTRQSLSAANIRLLANEADFSPKTSSFASSSEEAAWLSEMSKRLVKHLPDETHRLALLRTIHHEAIRAGIDPQWVLALIEVRSNFRKYIATENGERGYMAIGFQWAKVIGHPDDNLFNMRTNVRYGCVILRHYLNIEKGDMYRALGRYVGQIGEPEFPNAVRNAWRKNWQYKPKNNG